MWVLWVVLAIIVLAAMSGGLSLGLHLLAPHWSERRRILTASAVTAVLPMIIVFGGFFQEADVGQDDFFLSLAALTLLFFVILSVCALPPAWWTTTRLGRGDSKPVVIEHDEPELIEG
ncbi:hypothetical protein OZN62_00530 [Aurantiacibacter sp. MUD11]|uniref:hypothetical protein n=1 Tax=Aurantiacibacter sp. MUD11 TaxID=3003265 RepID=UPI0022AA6702|nr:hypothetical protein [Aurantiacibacter sp. MUD11]WAT18095.1 hypothetical protein OZN62_00530 [Aurantiacibacter sp. MUD11]